MFLWVFERRRRKERPQQKQREQDLTGHPKPKTYRHNDTFSIAIVLVHMFISRKMDEVFSLHMEKLDVYDG